MRNRATAPDEREGAIRGQWDYPATIMALRTPPDHERAELISAVVDAYGRLQDSVCRFLSMLADSLGEAPSSEALATRAFGDHIGSVSDLSRLRRDYPDWDVSVSVDEILRSMVLADAVAAR